MSVVTFEFPTLWSAGPFAVAVLLTGLVVKMMDDFLDLHFEVKEGRKGLAVSLGEGTLAYVLIMFCFAVLIDVTASTALLIGAYAIGMAGDFRRLLPTRLKGFHEAIIVIAAAMLALPWTLVLWALSVMLAVQLIDDWIDLRRDDLSGNPNLVRRLGRVETFLIAVICLAISMLLRPASTAIVLLSVPVVLKINDKLAKPIGRYKRWGSA